MEENERADIFSFLIQNCKVAIAQNELVEKFAECISHLNDFTAVTTVLQKGGDTETKSHKLSP